MRAITNHQRSHPVRHSCALAAAALLVLTLSSCDQLFGGMFNGETAQIIGQVDLSAEIPADTAKFFNLSVLSLAGIEYLLLFSSDGVGPSNAHLFVLGAKDMTVLNRYSLDDLVTTIPTPGWYFAGNSAVALPSGAAIIVGNVQLAPGTDGLAIVGKPPVQLNSGAMIGPTTAPNLWTGFRNDGSDNFIFDSYDTTTWTSTTVTPEAIGHPYQVTGVFADPEDSTDLTVLLVFHDDSGNHFFLQVPKDPDMANGWPSTPLFSIGAYNPFVKGSLDGGSIAFTKTGIAAYDFSSQGWVHFLPSTPTVVDRMSAQRGSDGLRSAFSWSGGWFCTFDPDSLMLRRYEDWW